jgi:DNA-binding transcriptional MerR regulator
MINGAGDKLEQLLRMKDLVARTGLTRDTIHFYIAEGLVPPPKKKRRNMAWYGVEHLERLNAIKTLQEERFLPLKAIKAVLAHGARDSGTAFTSGQTKLISQLKAELREEHTRSEEAVVLEALSFVKEFDRSEIDELAEKGVIDLLLDGSVTLISRADAEILGGLAEIKRVVDRPQGSWRPDDWAMLDRLASELIDYEIATFAERFPDVGTRPIDEVVDATVPIINRVFGILHMKKVRRFIMAFSPEPVPAPVAKAAEPGPKKGPRRRR